MIEHVFFDLDNTLWDFRKNSYCALQSLFQELEIEARYQLSFDTFFPYYSDINEELWAQFRDQKIEADYLKKQRFIRAFEELGIEDPSIAQHFYTHFLDSITHYNHLIVHSLELLDYLKPHYQLHVLSNGFEEVTHRKINHSALKGYFSTITSAEELQLRKPHPKIFQYALDKANAKKENSIFIGDDWIADGLGAYDFGMPSIFFNALQEDYSHEHIQQVDNLLQIQEIL